jgi:hypothetical protein
MSWWFSRVRGERRLPRLACYVPVLLLTLLARRRRTLGVYDLHTLALFRVVARRRRSADALLDYALYRRDLGYPLKLHWAGVLVTGLSRLSARRQRLALALLSEVATARQFDLLNPAYRCNPLAPPGSRERRGNSSQMEVLAAPSPLAGEGGGEGGDLLDARNQLTQSLQSKRGPHVPAIAALLQRAGHEADLALAQIFEQQERWRDEFAQTIRQQGDVGICVVGNSGALRRAGAGEWIDRHALVVRFNRFSSADADPRDLGSKLDVWCMAPGFRGDPPPRAPWIVVTGPDMQFRLLDWRNVKPALASGSRVLTVPLAVWRNLVSELMAPPSAGLLVLAWLREITGSWRGVHAIGFGDAVGAGARCHHSDPKQVAVARHNWAGERQVLMRWRGEGLDWVTPPVANAVTRASNTP